MLLVARKSTRDEINDSLPVYKLVHFSKVVTVQVIENISCVCIASYKHKSQGLGEFSQPLECLYQAIYANLYKKKVPYCFYKLTLLRKNAKLFVMALIKREILTSREVLYMYMKFHTHIISSCFA